MQQWHDTMKRQVDSIIVNTLEASETMLEEVDPDFAAPAFSLICLIPPRVGKDLASSPLRSAAVWAC